MIADILQKEGGFVDHPADKGGATNRGITHKTLSQYLGRTATLEELKSLKPELAQEIYYTTYYLSPRINALPEAIQPLMLDMCVNHGAKNALKMLQRVMNMAGVATVAEDGICGPETQRAAHNTQQAMGPYFQNALVDARLNFYHSIVSRNPSQFVFLKGWERRAESFRL